MKRIHRIKGACAVVALHYASGADEETTLRMCKLHNFEPEEGMDDEDWRDAAVSLGLKVRCHFVPPDTRLHKFIKEHPTGLFFVGTFDHLFVVDNGLVVDPRCAKPPGLTRIVKQAWRVCRR